MQNNMTRDKMIEYDELADRVGDIAKGLREVMYEQLKQIKELKTLIDGLKIPQCAMSGCKEYATDKLKVREDEDDSGHVEMFCASHATKIEDKAGETME